MQKSKIKILTFWIVILHFTFYILHLAPTALGQSPTPTSGEDVQEIREAVKEKVQAARAGQKRAFVGEITDINTTIILNTRQGEKQVRVSDETTIIGSGRKEIGVEDLEIGTFAIAMGYLEETDILDARRIVIIEEPKVPARLVAFGKVDDISSVEKILSVKHPKKGTVYEVEVISTTKITKKIEGEMETAKYEDIEIGDRLVAIGTPSEENNFLTAKLIHVIPGLAVGQEEATPTSEVTPSPETEE